jgi:dihydroxyacetone kinase-like predicted kinase
VLAAHREEIDALNVFPVPDQDTGSNLLATTAAAGALADTPRQLAALATAGVVNAGGRGLILLLEALVSVVTERPGVPSTTTARHQPLAAQVRSDASESALSHDYEVMYLLEGADEASAAVLRAELAELGDCDALSEQLRRAHPEVEMVVYAGDMPRCVLLVGVE